MHDVHIVPERCKIHLASYNGDDNPLDVFLAGDFDGWQSWQTRRNFERPLVVSLINLGRDKQWLFAGVFDSAGCDWIDEHKMHQYQLHRRVDTAVLEGRLVVQFERPGRQSYLLADNWAHYMKITELRAERLSIAAFPGYSSTLLTKHQLDVIVRQEIDSWKSALCSVAGVYVIADRKDGKLYVGKASGIGGIWERWCNYSWTGHGGNVELIQLLATKGADYSQHFQFGVLEIADTHASENEILQRECHWKDLLQTRIPHGYNAN